MLSRSQKRVQKKNAMVCRIILKPTVTKDHYILFQRYVRTRHKAGGMSDMNFNEFSSMVEDSKVHTELIEYRDENSVLLGVCLTDILDDGVSMVYSFFDPKLKNNSFGTFMILNHINYSKKLNLKYVYLGYWVNGSNKMQYKSSFSGLEVFASQEWRPLTNARINKNLNKPSNKDTTKKKILEIKLSS